jgi:hypothetical protein
MSSKKADAATTRSKGLVKSERRDWVRHASTVQGVYCRLFGDDRHHTFTGELQNISAQGAGLVCTFAFRTGAILELKPISSADQFPSKLLVRVKSSTARANGEWLLGCTFVRELSDEELEGLV